MISTFKLKQEDELLICCANAQINSNTKEKIKYLVKLDLEWDYILKNASKHALMPLLFFQLNQTCPEDVPGNIMCDLRDYYNLNARKNLFMLGELCTLLNLFEKHGLDVLPYKGPVLAIYAYKNLALRQFGDLDIFVLTNDVLKVKEILISNGYNPQFELGAFKESRFIKSQREYKFENPETKINLEVHWRFHGISLSLSDDLHFLTDPKNCGIVKIINKEILSLSPENMLLILIIHASGHLWERLSWISDISTLIQTHEMNWEYLLEKATELGIKRLLMVNLLLVHDLLDLNFPNNIIKQLKSRIVQDLAFKVKKKIFMPNSISTLEMMYIRLNIREKRVHRINDFFKIMFLPTNKEWDESPSKSFLPPVSYLFKLVHVLKNYRK